jgi:hypothetical protein
MVDSKAARNVLSVYKKMLQMARGNYDAMTKTLQGYLV